MFSRKRKLLLIGGTGTISTAVTKRIAQSEAREVYLFNRGLRKVELPENVKLIKGDISNEEEAAKLYKNMGTSLWADFPGWNIGIITSNEDFQTNFGHKANSIKKLKAGNLDTAFYIYNRD